MVAGVTMRIGYEEGAVGGPSAASAPTIVHDTARKKGNANH